MSLFLPLHNFCLLLKTLNRTVDFTVISTSNHMFGRAMCDKLPEKNEGNFKIFKNHEGDLSQKFPEPNVIAGQSHQTNILYWN